MHSVDRSYHFENSIPEDSMQPRDSNPLLTFNDIFVDINEKRNPICYLIWFGKINWTKPLPNRTLKSGEQYSTILQFIMNIPYVGKQTYNFNSSWANIYELVLWRHLSKLFIQNTLDSRKCY